MHGWRCWCTFLRVHPTVGCGGFLTGGSQVRVSCGAQSPGAVTNGESHVAAQRVDLWLNGFNSDQLWLTPMVKWFQLWLNGFIYNQSWLNIENSYIHDRPIHRVVNTRNKSGCLYVDHSSSRKMCDGLLVISYNDTIYSIIYKQSWDKTIHAMHCW